MNQQTMEKMVTQQETYPENPDVILSDDIYALRISVFENDAEMGFHNYSEEEQKELRSCIRDLVPFYHSRFTFDVDTEIGEDNEWVDILVCRMDGEYNVPFPISLVDRVVYYSNGKEKHLLGDKLLISPRSTTYKWADKVEILLEEYDG